MKDVAQAKIFKNNKKPAPDQLSRNLSKMPVNKDSIEGMTPETDKMVTGKFRNLEYPGQTAKITCRLYKGQNLFSQVMEDERVYTIPLSVARFINRDCCYPIANFLLDEDGNYIKGTGRQVHRYQFSSQDFE